MANERFAPRATRAVLVAAIAAMAFVAVVMLATAQSANANYPTCTDYNHSTWAVSNCQDSGVTINVRCASANLRNGPGIDYDQHGTVVSGNNGHRWKIVYRNPAVNAACGGLSTNEWWLTPTGWISRSALWN